MVKTNLPPEILLQVRSFLSIDDRLCFGFLPETTKTTFKLNIVTIQQLSENKVIQSISLQNNRYLTCVKEFSPPYAQHQWQLSVITCYESNAVVWYSRYFQYCNETHFFFHIRFNPFKLLFPGFMLVNLF